MKKATTTFGLLLSFIAPLTYILMYLPIWNDKELVISNIHPTIIFFFVFQCFALLCSIVHFLLVLLKKYSYILSFIFLLIAIPSILLTCLIGYFFILELFNIPWFPAQR